jgi:2-desacetyl-2-hydroxyethyl bacteriochlorophyllide A dehydrogenase
MRALTVIPLQAGSAAVVDMPDPEPGPGELLVDGIALGVCGTDREIVAGDYGWAPPGEERLILGHESLGRVTEAPADSEFAAGDLVVGVVRRPDPEPCIACARGEFDFCRNGNYTERGIKEIHGYGSERWTVEADYAVKLDPELEPVGMLMEPTTIVAKAWDQIERIGRRAYFAPERVLITGAGPIGLVSTQAALAFGATDVVVSDVNPARLTLAEDLGATEVVDVRTASVTDLARPPTVLLECSGHPAATAQAIRALAPAGRAVLVGMGGDELPLPLSVVQERELEVTGTFRYAGTWPTAIALVAAGRIDLDRLVTGSYGLDRAEEALTAGRRDPQSVKVVVHPQS